MLDTHIVSWLAFEPENISKKAAEVIAQARLVGDGLGIADMTLWELAMMVSRGRIQPTVPLESFLREIEANFIVFPVSASIAARSMQFTAAYPSDPMDRVIGATALVQGMSLVTADRKIQASKEVPFIW
nr:type II toxin-antitoxin system VapC family toxin [Granulicella arctica]